MMRRVVGLAAAILVLSPAVVLAEGDETAARFSDPGWYAGLGVTFNRLATGTEIRGVTGSISREPLTGINVVDSIGINGRVGYRLFKHLSIELDGCRIVYDPPRRPRLLRFVMPRGCRGCAARTSGTAHCPRSTTRPARCSCWSKPRAVLETIGASSSRRGFLPIRLPTRPRAESSGMVLLLSG